MQKEEERNPSDTYGLQSLNENLITIILKVRVTAQKCAGGATRYQPPQIAHKEKINQLF
jgi:hypothetical protein